RGAGELDDVGAEVVGLGDSGDGATGPQGFDVAGRSDLSQHLPRPHGSFALHSMVSSNAARPGEPAPISPGENLESFGRHRPPPRSPAVRRWRCGPCFWPPA